MDWLDAFDAHVHILLDPRGKTLSHVYAELPARAARSALRVSRSKIMGSGRRARPVTVTMSTEEELMKDVKSHRITLTT